MKCVIVLLVIFSVFASTTMACQAHNEACTSDENGSQGNCCGGLHCLRSNPSLRAGRCYYNAGKK